MDLAIRKQLREIFETVAADEDIRVIVLRGAGDETFVTGGDLEAFADCDLIDSLEYVTEHAQGLYNLSHRCQRPRSPPWMATPSAGVWRSQWHMTSG